jgi:hypothetical protein
VCARGIEFVSVCDVFLLDFGPVPTVRYFCFSFFLVKLWFHYYSNIFSYRSYQKCLNNDIIYSSKVIYCIYVIIHSFYILNTIILQQLGRNITLNITLSGLPFFHMFLRLMVSHRNCSFFLMVGGIAMQYLLWLFFLDKTLLTYALS